MNTELEKEEEQVQTRVSI